MILLLYALNNIVYHFVPFLNFIFYYCLYHLATQTTRLPTEPCWREQRRGKRCSGGMEVGLLIQIMAILPQHQDLLPSRLFQLLQRNRRQKAPAPTAEEQGECVSLMQFQCPGLVSPAPCTASPRGQGQPSRSFQQGRHHSSPGGIFVPFYCISAFRRMLVLVETVHLRTQQFPAGSFGCPSCITNMPVSNGYMYYGSSSIPQLLFLKKQKYRWWFWRQMNKAGSFLLLRNILLALL